MAAVASGWVTRGDVVGNETTQGLRSVPGGLMTAVASGVRGSQRVVVVHMAIGAANDLGARSRRHLVRAR